MSWLDYRQIKSYRWREDEVVLQVAEILFCEGYYVKSISSSYRYSKTPKFNKICLFRHSGGFDLLLVDEDFRTIGVEVKTVLSMNSYQSALGQAMVYMNHNKDRISRAIIFARRFQSEKIFYQIREDYYKTLKKTNLPITIRTIESVTPYRYRGITN